MSVKRFVKQAPRRFVYLCLLLRHQLRAKPNKYLLILGHMRSGSTLLLHILLSNRLVLGCGERNSTYGKRFDLVRLALDSYYFHKTISGRYVWFVDQINHSKFLPSVELLNNPSVWRIFLLREPETAIASMVHTLDPLYGDWTVARAADYYLKRVTALEHYASSIDEPQRSMFLLYDDLIDRTNPVLEQLQSFLGLQLPKSDEYETYSFTGRGRGDPSSRILAGRIIRNKQQPRIDIPPEALDAAHKAYSSCRETLGRMTRREPS